MNINWSNVISEAEDFVSSAIQTISTDYSFNPIETIAFCIFMVFLPWGIVELFRNFWTIIHSIATVVTIYFGSAYLYTIIETYYDSKETNKF